MDLNVKILADEFTKRINTAYKEKGVTVSTLYAGFVARIGKLREYKHALDGDATAIMPYLEYWSQHLSQNLDIAIALTAHDKSDYLLNQIEPDVPNFTLAAEKYGLHVSSNRWVLQHFDPLVLRKAETLTLDFYRGVLRQKLGKHNKGNNKRQLLIYAQGNNKFEGAHSYYLHLFYDLQRLDPKYRLHFREQLTTAMNNPSAKNTEKLWNSDYFLFLSVAFETQLIIAPFWSELIEALKNIFGISTFPDDIFVHSKYPRRAHDFANYDWDKVTEIISNHVKTFAVNDDIQSELMRRHFVTWKVALAEWKTVKDITSAPPFANSFKNERISNLPAHRPEWEHFLYRNYLKDVEVMPILRPAISHLDAIIQPMLLAELLHLKPEDATRYQLLTLTRGAYRNLSEATGLRYLNNNDGLPTRKINNTAMFYRLGNILNTIYQAQFKRISTRKLKYIETTKTDLESASSLTQLEATLLDKSKLALELSKKADVSDKKTITDVISAFKSSREAAFKWLYTFYYQSATKQAKKLSKNATSEQENLVKIESLINEFHLKPKLAKKIVERKGVYHRKEKKL